MIRWSVATELFRESEQREPTDDAELKAFIARVARPPRQQRLRKGAVGGDVDHGVVIT